MLELCGQSLRAMSAPSNQYWMFPYPRTHIEQVFRVVPTERLPERMVETVEQIVKVVQTFRQEWRDRDVKRIRVESVEGGRSISQEQTV